MKKVVVYILSVFMTVFLVACRNNNTPSEKTDNNDNKGMSHYEIGDIILGDGSIVKVQGLNQIDNSHPPIAVIVDLKNNGTVLGMGVHRSKSPLQWTQHDSAGYKIKFKDIVAQSHDENADKANFIGDIDGSDNWEYICLNDKQDAENDSNNYPAFQFVNTYAKNYHLNNNFASDWYMPSIAELCMIYKNKDIINTSLQKIYELDKNAAMNGLGTNWYWSSSQSNLNDDYVWFVHYYNGYVSDCPKDFTNLHVLTVRIF